MHNHPHGRATASISKSIETHARAFAASQSGSVAITFAGCVIAFLICIGAAIDYARVAQAKNTLRGMADGAALAAVSKQAIAAGATTTAQIAASDAIARQYFAAHQLPTGSTLESLTPAITGVNGRLQASIQYSVSVPLFFGAVLGRPAVTVADTSVASSGGPSYIDLYILVDASTSMGIGATDADQRLMFTTPAMFGGPGGGGTGCTVACHNAGTDTIARNAGATLRFDVIKSAVDQILTGAQGVGANTHIRVGLYTFANKLKTEIDLTADLTAAKAANTTMDLADYDAGTNVAFALAALKNKIGAAGDGSSQASPSAYVILATDGVGNSADNTSPTSPDAGGWIISPDFVPYSPHMIPDPVGNGVMDLEGLDPNWCKPIKDLGVGMMTLETTYVVSPYEPWNTRYDYIRSTLAPNITANMAACASKPSFNISASHPTEITTAMNKLFNTALAGNARLTR